MTINFGGYVITCEYVEEIGDFEEHFVTTYDVGKMTKEQIVDMNCCLIKAMEFYKQLLGIIEDEADLEYQIACIKQLFESQIEYYEEE